MFRFVTITTRMYVFMIQVALIKASQVVYKGITQLWEVTVCPKGKYKEWHRT